MHLSYKPLTLDLIIPFRIAHGVSTQRHNVLVQIEDGIGEAAAVPHYQESQNGIMEYLAGISGQLSDDPLLIEDILQRLPAGSLAARCAIDIALHDLLGKRAGMPLYRLLGLNPASCPPTSYTISIDEPHIMAQRARECGFDYLKIKLGSGDDLAMLRAVRSATSARLRVDANAGWTRQQAMDLIPKMEELDLEFVEQPLDGRDVEGLRWLRSQLQSQKVKLPLFADESVRTARDVANLQGAVDGVVIKLMKACGIREALRAIHTARSLDMQIMLSCMVESSIAVTAAAHLAPLVDYIDLDSPLMLRNDPYQGITYQGSRVTLPEAPGLGLTLR